MHFQTVNPLILTLKIDIRTLKNHDLLSIFTTSINNKPSGDPSGNVNEPSGTAIAAARQRAANRPTAFL
jgi:hypothetical protein